MRRGGPLLGKMNRDSARRLLRRRRDSRHLLGQTDCNQEGQMGFRFQKRIPILPGVWINLSKSGVSASLGERGSTINIGKNGPTATVGLPGTGLSYRAGLSTTLLLVLLAAAAIVGIAYLVAPELVKPLLHYWKPKWF
jgi:hypothetical protein